MVRDPFADWLLRIRESRSSVAMNSLADRLPARMAHIVGFPVASASSIGDPFWPPTIPLVPGKSNCSVHQSSYAVRVEISSQRSENRTYDSGPNSYLRSDANPRIKKSCINEFRIHRCRTCSKVSSKLSRPTAITLEAVPLRQRVLHRQVGQTHFRQDPDRRLQKSNQRSSRSP